MDADHFPSDLFEFAAWARASDPQTAKDAAQSIWPDLPDLELTVLKAVRQSEASGATVDELVSVTGLEKVTVSPRLRPLADKGFVITAATRPGKSGRQQTVWVAKEYEHAHT